MAAALLLWLLFATVPGFLVLTATSPALDRLHRTAAAPATSIGLAFAPAAWADRIHPGSGVAVATLSLVTASVASLAVVLRRRRAPSPALSPGSVGLLAVVVLAVALNLALLARSAPGWDAVAPADDGMSHGLFTARILTTGSLDPLVVTSPDPVSGALGSVYPLGLHLVAALVARLTGVASAITVVAVLGAAVWAPLATAAWARRIGLTRTVVWVAAGLVALATPWFPWAQLTWGGLALVAGVALLPAVTALLLSVRLGGLSLIGPAIALAGVACVHLAEAGVAVLLALLTIVLDPARARGRVSAAVLVTAVAGVLLLAPLALQVVGSGSPSSRDEFVLGGSDAIVELLAHPALGYGVTGGLTILTASLALAWWALAAAGSRWAWQRPAARGTTVLGWSMVLLAYAAFLGTGGLITSPWYSNGYRILVQAVALLVLPISVGLTRLAAGSGRARVWRISLLAVGCAALTGASLASGSAAWAASTLTAHDRQAIAWLDAHAADGGRVLNDPTGPGGWAYALTDGRVATVFGAKPGGPWVSGDGWTTAAGWGRRLDLLRATAGTTWTADARDDARVAGVRFVLVTEGMREGAARAIDAESLAAIPGVREVFASGGARVFELPA